MSVLQPQAALESAVVVALRAGGGPGGAAIPASQCARMYDGQPPSAMGNVFYAVWYDAGRPNQGQRTRYEELFGVYITISIRFTQPFDRWLIHRDDLEMRANAAKALIGLDQRNFSVVNAADALAGLRSSGDGVTVARPGWVESLLFAGYDPKRGVGPDWFHAETESNKGLPVGVAQRIRFVGAKRVQAVQLAVS